jgi:hypothetical protein
MKSRIDDILAIIDNVFGPETDDTFLPTDRQMAGIEGRVYSPWTELAARSCAWTRRMGQPNTRGTYGVRELNGLGFDALNEHLGARGERPLAHNTWVSRNIDGRIHVTYHSTTIVTYQLDPDGVILMTLNTGGYHTVTTKQRINALLPDGYRLYSKKFELFIQTPLGDERFYDGYMVEVPA